MGKKREKIKEKPVQKTTPGGAKKDTLHNLSKDKNTKNSTKVENSIALPRNPMASLAEAVKKVRSAQQQRQRRRDKLFAQRIRTGWV